MKYEIEYAGWDASVCGWTKVSFEAKTSLDAINQLLNSTKGDPDRVYRIKSVKVYGVDVLL